jgi:exodeoxyribonuclease VII small subunit
MKQQFEERLSRLEELAAKIKDPDLPLEEAVDVFEEGVKLSKGLERDLAKIQGRVEVLLNEPQGADEKPELGLFDSGSGDEGR